MSVKEYASEFSQLAKYAPTIVVDYRLRMSKFVWGVSHFIFTNCYKDMLIKEMDVSCLTVHA